MPHLPLPHLGVAPVRVEIQDRLSLGRVSIEKLFAAWGLGGDFGGDRGGGVEVPRLAKGKAVIETGAGGGKVSFGRLQETAESRDR